MNKSKTIIPRVVFRYSWIYDEGYRNSKGIQAYLKKHKKKYPSYREIINYIHKVELLWRKHEKKVLPELSRITGLKWKEKEILCYVIGCGKPFSDPLTISIYPKNYTYFIDTLVHELIHVLQIHNDIKMKAWWRYIQRKYVKESRTTQNHILLHAIHTVIYLKLFNKKRLANDIKKCQAYPDYNRSWEIVQNMGYEKIIKEFRKRVK